jgi:hypothetical protein
MNRIWVERNIECITSEVSFYSLLLLLNLTGANWQRYRDRYKTQIMKAFDVPTPEELIQKP